MNNPRSVYTAEELAQAIGVSQRTCYTYLSKGLLPEGRRVGRQVVYSTLHLHYGLLIRALLGGGLGLPAVGGVLGRLSATQVQTFAAPLTALIEARSRLEEELAAATRQLRPADSDLDFHDMGLEDPIALQARISAWESELRSLGRQLDVAFSDVSARLLEDSGEGTPSTPSDDQRQWVGLRSDIQALTAAVRDLALVLAAQPFGNDGQAQPAARAAAARLRRANDLDAAP